MASVTFTRALVTGSPGDLTISDMPGAGPYWLEQIIEPEFDQRNTYADDSPDVPGSLLIQSVTGLGTLGLTIWTHATDAATLRTQKRDLEAAIRGQFSYTTTLTNIGSDSYTSQPGKVSWGTASLAKSLQLVAQAVVTIPVQPLGV